MTIKILVQPRPHAAHREVEVEINWDAISQDDIKFLAQQLILHNLQAKIRAGFYQGDEFPTFISVRAEWEVHRDCVGVKDYKIPTEWTSGTDKPVKLKKVPKVERSLFDMLNDLTVEEREALLR